MQRIGMFLAAIFAAPVFAAPSLGSVELYMIMDSPAFGCGSMAWGDNAFVDLTDEGSGHVWGQSSIGRGMINLQSQTDSNGETWVGQLNQGVIKITCANDHCTALKDSTFNIDMALSKNETQFDGTIDMEHVSAVNSDKEISVTGPYAWIKLTPSKDNDKELVYSGNGSASQPFSVCDYPFQATLTMKGSLRPIKDPGLFISAIMVPFGYH